MARDYEFYVYMTTNYAGTVLYIGVTSDLEGRIWEHQHGEGSKFTSKYHADRLLYYEHFGDVHRAIEREKQLKGWTRAKKEALIRRVNPNREDITYTLDPQWRPTVGGPSASLGMTENLEGNVDSQSTLEGPSTTLVPRSAQDDRVLKSSVDKDGNSEGLASPVSQTRLSTTLVPRSAQDDRNE